MIPLGQLKHWAIIPSFALIEQSQTNAVAQCFIWTRKGRVNNGREFQNLEKVIATVGGLEDNYNS
jgi:hypothetical protein